MRINTRFTVAVHILSLIALGGDKPAASEMMAASVGNHPVVIRQVMSSLKKAGLIETQSGLPGGRLTRSQEEMTLLDIYRAVKAPEDAPLFDVHPNPNPDCPVGRNIAAALEEPLSQAQAAMEKALDSYTLKSVTEYIAGKYAAENES